MASKPKSKVNGVKPCLKTGGKEATQFKPGQSGNPGGRPKGLAALAREKTGDGKMLVETAVAIATGKLLIRRMPPSHRDRIMAIEWLADRGFGSKPAVEVNVNTDVTVSTGKDPAEMTVPEMQAELAKRRAQPEPWAAERNALQP